MCEHRLLILLLFLFLFVCCCLAYMVNWVVGVLQLPTWRHRITDPLRTRPKNILSVFLEPGGRRALFSLLAAVACLLVLLAVSKICGPGN